MKVKPHQSIAVECGFCSAVAGQPCQGCGSDLPPSKTHVARKRLYDSEIKSGILRQQ